jgi:hypothetical protein
LLVPRTVAVKDRALPLTTLTLRWRKYASPRSFITLSTSLEYFFVNAMSFLSIDEQTSYQNKSEWYFKFEPAGATARFFPFAFHPSYAIGHCHETTMRGSGSSELENSTQSEDI